MEGLLGGGVLMPRAAYFAILLSVLSYIAVSVTNSATPADIDLERQFSQTVRPFVTTYCTGCHSGATPAGNFDLQKFSTMASVVNDYTHWALVVDKLSAKAMPPKPMKQPPDDARQQVIDWIGDMRKNEALKNAGDPGPVLARRLSNSEYNYTIRDLTGVDLQPAREFPVDPANQAGFDNSGESLTMSSALMAKYLQAAREVGDHMVLRPDGIAFAPYPMLVETDREKYAVQRILDFYSRQPIDFADYFQAAWRYKHRAIFGEPKATLAFIAAETKVSPKYLPMVWQELETREEVGPLAKLQTMWADLPVPKADQPALAHDGCVRMRDFVVKIRKHTQRLMFPPNDGAGRGGGGGNSIVNSMWKNRLVAATHREFDPSALRVESEPAQAGELVVTRGPTFGASEVEALKVAVAAYIKERREDPDLVVPAGQRARYESAFARFASVFPDKFYLRERGRFYPVEIDSDIGRYLSAGLHSMMGYFRDDTPMVELILDDKQKKEIDTLWQEFEFISDYSRRTYIQSSGGGGRGGPAQTETGYRDVTAESVILAARDQAIARAGNNPALVQAIKDHYDGINGAIRWAERARLEAEPRHLDELLKFAARAYRRPLAQDERQDILAYYHELREKNNLSHEDAVRASIVSLLVSPDFCYRVDLVDAAGSSATAKPAVSPMAVGTRPLSGYALASRLSYFLWSSMPDEELLAHAGAGDLSKPPVLSAQVQRMLRDGRSHGLATEFAGNWLDFRRFEENNSVDRERFPAFTNELREAMFEEPIRFIDNVIRNDRPLLDLLYGNYTFVNPLLAKHYGMPAVAGGPDDWIRVDDARAYGRGGLLPMAVFLTQNAPGLRTSPVKRGYWVARRVLGEVIPPPPPVVPELPQDESKSDLPVRDMLAKHRENPACASCHARFDVFGLTFEGYGPIGERRTHDLAGRPVDTHATFPGGDQGAGLEGLQAYIRVHRQNDFLRNVSEKLLVYGLGRSSMLSDEPLLEQMQTKLTAGGYRFSTLVEAIVTSPQFLNKRNTDSEEKGNSDARTNQAVRQ